MASEMHGSITLELVTPAFIGGAEPRGKPEFRIPSLRGALRYWWRALFGAGVEDWTTLLQKESELFGSTKKASAVQLHLLSQNDAQVLDYSAIIPHDFSSVNYLWFSAKKRSAIAAGSQYQIAITFRHQDPELQNQFYAALWLLTRLGGIGTRSRRGAGGIQVVDIQSSSQLSNLPPLPIRATTVEQFGKELQSGIQQLRRNVSTNTLPSQPTFHLLHPEFAEICLINCSFSSWQEALNFIGFSLQDFRKSEFSKDARIVSDIILQRDEHPNETIERAVFGLPLPFFFRRKQERKENQKHQQKQSQQKQGEIKGTVHPRRGSPLFIRVVKLADQQRYAVVITFFKARFLDEHRRLNLQGKSLQAPSSYEPIVQWLNSLDRLDIELGAVPSNEG